MDLDSNAVRRKQMLRANHHNRCQLAIPFQCPAMGNLTHKEIRDYLAEKVFPIRIELGQPRRAELVNVCRRCRANQFGNGAKVGVAERAAPHPPILPYCLCGGMGVWEWGWE